MKSTEIKAYIEKHWQKQTAAQMISFMRVGKDRYRRAWVELNEEGKVPKSKPCLRSGKIARGKWSARKPKLQIDDDKLISLYENRQGTVAMLSYSLGISEGQLTKRYRQALERKGLYVEGSEKVELKLWELHKPWVPAKFINTNSHWLGGRYA